MSIMLTEVKIDGTDVISYLAGWEVVEQFGQEINECEIRLTKKIFDVLPGLSVGNTITIKRGVTTSTDQFIFDGYVDKIDKEVGYVIVRGRDKMIDLLAKQVTYSYDSNIDPSAGQGGEIARNLIVNRGGMSATIIATPPAITILKFICNHVSIFSKLKELADIYDYSLYYDSADGTVHFEPKGYVTKATVLTVGDNVHNLPKWHYDFSQCVNKITVLGAEQIVEDTELFNGTGLANQQNTLADIPISVVAYVGGVQRTPGVRDATSGIYDYEIDKENRNINWNQAYAPPVGSNNIQITYTRALPIPLTIGRASSITSYGLRETSRHFSNLQTMEDAETTGESYLDKFAEPFVATMVKVDGTYDYDVGNLVRIIDGQHNEDRWVLIHKIIRRFPYSGDELHVGDKEWRLAEWGKLTMDRIKRLEELNTKNQDLTVQVEDLSKSIEAGKTKVLQVFEKTVTGLNCFILGHTVYGILGTGRLGDGSITSESMIRTVWKDQTVVEKFVDTDFKDASATTATWTTTGTCTLGVSAASERAHWKLNNNANDSSGNGFNGISTSTWVAGKINQAANFNGSQEIDTHDTDTIFTSNTNWTIAFWFNPNSITALSSAVDRLFTAYRSATSNGLSLILRNSNTLSLYYHDGASFNYADCGTVSTGTWYHVILTYDGTSFNVYLDNGTPTTVIDSFAGFGSGNFIIGARNAVGADGCDAIVDDFRAYLRIISSSDRATIYNGGTGTEATLPGGAQIAQSEIVYDNIVNLTSATLSYDGSYSVDSDLEGHYKFNGDATDSSFNGFDGTASNITWSTGKINQAAETTASVNEYIDLVPASNYFPNKDDWAMTFWFTADVVTSDQKRLIANYDVGGGLHASFFLEDYGLGPKLRFYYKDNVGSWSIQDILDVTVSTWYHVIAMYNGTKYQIYIDNGTPTEITDTCYGFSGSTDTRLLGTGVGITTVDGKIDDLRFYKRSLTAAERTAIYSAGAGTEDFILSDSPFYLQVDGTNWENVTPDTEHTFINVGQELKWKIENAIGTLTRVNIEVNE